jgi:multiple sugar transport system substrate-binding protein
MFLKRHQVKASCRLVGMLHCLLWSGAQGHADDVLRVLSFKDGHALAVQSMLPSFSKSTGVQVAMDLIPASSVSAKIVTDQTGVPRYDVYLVDEPFVPELAAFLLPVAQWPGAGVGVSPQDFVASSWSATVSGTTSYGLPVNGNVYMYTHRKDLFEDPHEQRRYFERYGLPLSKPSSAQDFERIAAFFHRPPRLYGFAPFTKMSEGTTVEMLWLLGLFEVQLMDADGGLAAKPESIATALAWYRRLMRYAPPGSRSWHHPERLRAYARGIIAQMMTWPSFLRDFENPQKSLVVGKSLYGSSAAWDRTAVAGTWVAAVNRRTTKPAQAAAFARWWARVPEPQELLARGMNPARRDVLTDERWQQQFPWFSATLQALEKAQVRPRSPQYRQVSKLLSEAFTSAVTAPGPLESCAHCKKVADDLVEALRKQILLVPLPRPADSQLSEVVRP